MRKIGFTIEMLILLVALGWLILTRGGWVENGAMSIFPGENISQEKKNTETEEAENNVAQGEAVKEEKVEEPVETAPDPNTPAGRAYALGLSAPPEIDINSWEYILVNGDHTIDGTFVPEIGIAVSQSSESNQDARIVDKLNAFAAGAEAQGLPVYLSSGYRSYETQQMLFDLKCEEYDYDTAATIVAIPGTSEHQTGLCCDITDVYRDPKNSELENTDTYKWMYAHCAEYGFILRFPKGKEDITKIIYEPWHFRYVGEEAAKYIMDNDLTLEQFVAFYTGE